jgi:hypothetical protein
MNPVERCVKEGVYRMGRCQYSNRWNSLGLQFSSTKKSFQINYRLENSRNLFTQAAVYSDFCLGRCSIRDAI